MDRASALKIGSLVVLTVNSILFVYKLGIGLYIHSYALVSDSLNSLTDALLGFSMFLGMAYAYLPPDEEHAFGHGRAEHIILFILAATLVGTGAAILAGEYFDVGHLSVVRYSLTYILLIAITIPAKFFLGLYVSRIGRKKSAEFMTADFWHEQSDNLVTIAVIIGVILSSRGYYFVDPAIGAAIAVFLVCMGIKYGKKSISLLMGGFQDKEVIEKARKLAMEVQGVRNTGKIEIHEYGERSVVNITIVLSGDLDASSAHTISHIVESKLQESGFFSVHVHMDTGKSALLDDIERIVSEIISGEDQVAGFHDIEVRESLGISVVDLHLTMEGEIGLREAHDIAHRVDRKFRLFFPDFRLQAHLEPRKE